MPENYSLKVKLGEAEFTADGPEETVKEAYQQFLDAIQKSGIPQAPTRSGEEPSDTPKVTRSLLEKAFRKERDDVVSLRMQPTGEGEQQRNADAAILLIYGFQEYLGMEDAPVTKLNDGLRKSGIMLKRLDRFIGTHDELFLKGGSRSGGRYSLTNPGRDWAEKKLKSMFGNS
ncbi:MAG: hypothetical protein ACREMD_00735 [Gemmatimonadota bacterium]